MEEQEAVCDHEMMERLGTDHDEDIWALINAHKQVRHEGDGEGLAWYETNKALDKKLNSINITLVKWKVPVQEQLAEVFYVGERLGLTVPFQLEFSEISPYSARMIKEIMLFNRVKKWENALGFQDFSREVETRSSWHYITVEDVGAAFRLSSEGEGQKRKYSSEQFQHLFQTPRTKKGEQSASSVIDHRLQILLSALAALFTPEYRNRVANAICKHVIDGLHGQRVNWAALMWGMITNSCKALGKKGKQSTRLAPLLFPYYAWKGWLTRSEFEWYVESRTKIRQFFREKKVAGDWRVILNSMKLDAGSTSEAPVPEQPATSKRRRGRPRKEHPEILSASGKRSRQYRSILKRLGASRQTQTKKAIGRRYARHSIENILENSKGAHADQSESALPTDSKFHQMKVDINLVLSAAKTCAQRSLAAIDQAEKMEFAWLVEKEALIKEVKDWRGQAAESSNLWLAEKEALREEIQEWQGKTAEASDSIVQLKETLRDKDVVCNRYASIIRDILPSKRKAENLIKIRDEVQSRLTNTENTLGVQVEVLKVEDAQRELRDHIVEFNRARSGFAG